MTDATSSPDLLSPMDKPKLPGGLNVLTILTFVGCAFEFLTRCWNFFNAKTGLDKMEEMINSGKLDEMPAIARKMFTPEMLEMARKAYENRVPIFAITMIGVVLCLIGALQMRKLKAQGYYLYVVGEIMPLLASLLFLGASSLTGMMGIIGICIVLLFILLYTGQRKYLINK